VVSLLQSFRDALRQHVLVLLNKACHVINDIAGVMRDHELGSVELARFLDMRVLVLHQVRLLDSSQKV